MKVGGAKPGGVDPSRRGSEAGPADAAKFAEAARSAGAAPSAGGPGASDTAGQVSQAMEKLRRTVGPIAGDPERATRQIVEGLLKGQYGPDAAKEPGFEKMADAVAARVKEDPALCEALEKVIEGLAQP